MTGTMNGALSATTTSSPVARTGEHGAHVVRPLAQGLEGVRMPGPNDIPFEAEAGRKTAARTGPIENGAERGEHIIRPQGAAVKERRQRLLQAMASEDKPRQNPELKRPSTNEQIDKMPGAGPPTADEAVGEGDGTLDE